MSNIIPYKNNNEDKYPFKQEYCKLLLDYAYENVNIDGFYGELLIPPKVALQWEDDYPEWKEAVELAEYRCVAGLNRSLKKLIEMASGDPAKMMAPDIDLVQKVVFRMADISFKTEKDSGMLKRKGMDKAKRSKANTNINNQKNSVASSIAEELLNINKKE